MIGMQCGMVSCDKLCLLIRGPNLPYLLPILQLLHHRSLINSAENVAQKTEKIESTGRTSNKICSSINTAYQCKTAYSAFNTNTLLWLGINTELRKKTCIKTTCKTDKFIQTNKSWPIPALLCSGDLRGSQVAINTIHTHLTKRAPQLTDINI